MLPDANLYEFGIAFERPHEIEADCVAALMRMYQELTEHL